MKTAYLGLGSNLGDRAANLSRALALLDEEDLRIAARSSLYETAPRDFLDQPSFLNMAVCVETRLFPLQLLHTCLRVERQLGRKRTVPKGPRIIDIDILLYGSVQMATEELTIPHPELPERRFVLEPLLEIAPDLRHPASRRPVRELLEAVRAQRVEKLMG